MKIIKTEFLKSYNAIIALMLAILGFSSCKDSPDEYGTPHAKFILNGKIEDANTNQAIENIQVEVEYETTYSDSEGNYHLEVESFPEENRIFELSAKDVDGNENGEYLDLDTIVEFKDAEFKNGDGDWYDGETTKKMDIKLTPKK